MIRAVLPGAKYTNAGTLVNVSLQKREEAVEKKIGFYRNTAAVEGGITGAGRNGWKMDSDLNILL